MVDDRALTRMSRCSGRHRLILFMLCAATAVGHHSCSCCAAATMSLQWAARCWSIPWSLETKHETKSLGKLYNLYAMLPCWPLAKPICCIPSIMSIVELLCISVGVLGWPQMMTQTLKLTLSYHIITLMLTAGRWILQSNQQTWYQSVHKTQSVPVIGQS